MPVASDSQLPYATDGRLRGSANPWVAGERDHISAARESLRGIVLVCVEHGPVLRAIAEAAPLDERLVCAWSIFMTPWDDAVAARVEAHHQAGLVPPFDARLMAHAPKRLDVAVLNDAFGHRPQADPEAVLDTLHRVWVGTLYAVVPDHERSGRMDRRLTEAGTQSGATSRTLPHA